MNHQKLIEAILPSVVAMLAEQIDNAAEQLPPTVLCELEAELLQAQATVKRAIAIYVRNASAPPALGRI